MNIQEVEREEVKREFESEMSKLESEAYKRCEAEIETITKLIKESIQHRVTVISGRK